MSRWDRQIAKAERELAANKKRIEATPRGTRAQKANEHRVGKGPGSAKTPK